MLELAAFNAFFQDSLVIYFTSRREADELNAMKEGSPGATKFICCDGLSSNATQLAGLLVEKLTLYSIGFIYGQESVPTRITPGRFPIVFDDECNPSKILEEASAPEEVRSVGVKSQYRHQGDELLELDGSLWRMQERARRKGRLEGLMSSPPQSRKHVAVISAPFLIVIFQLPLFQKLTHHAYFLM
jgi:hypothetical protein